MEQATLTAPFDGVIANLFEKRYNCLLYTSDSRYWGLLPEKFIVGKATLIWKSVDLDTDEIRWNRVFKRIE